VIATACLYRSAHFAAEAATVLSRPLDAARYGALADTVRAAFTEHYVTDDGRIRSDCATVYALALHFGLLDPDRRARAGERLAEVVRAAGHRISTGFAGTPYVTWALAATGHVDDAYALLLQTECPSWLYPITMGATTIWERWDSMLEDGSINPGEMTSFNHYALGAVADWLHRVVAGLAPAAPGYHRLEIAPRPLPALDWAATRHLTPYGEARVAWRRDGGQVVISAHVPANAGAHVSLPDGRSFDVVSGDHEWTVAAEAEPAPSPLTTSTPLSAIMDDPGAYRAVVDAFSRIDPAVGKDFTRRTAWVPNRPLFGSFSLISPAVVEAVENSLAELNARRGA